MFNTLIAFLSETPDRIEEVLRSLKLPWLIQSVIDALATHPVTSAVIIALMGAGLLFALYMHFTNTRRFEEALKEREASFPRREWETMGRLDATRIIEEAQHLFAVRPGREGTAVHDAVLGLLFLQRGDAARAETYLRQAIVLFEEIGHREGIAFYAHYLGLLYEELGDLERAVMMEERSRAMYRALGRPVRATKLPATPSQWSTEQ
ncbi:MAG: tetratricopeptide repeat protein [Alphaproteobacteria bacterium]